MSDKKAKTVNSKYFKLGAVWELRLNAPLSFKSPGFYQIQGRQSGGWRYLQKVGPEPLHRNYPCSVREEPYGLHVQCKDLIEDSSYIPISTNLNAALEVLYGVKPSFQEIYPQKGFTPPKPFISTPSKIKPLTKIFNFFKNTKVTRLACKYIRGGGVGSGV